MTDDCDHNWIPYSMKRMGMGEIGGQWLPERYTVSHVICTECWEIENTPNFQ